MRASARWANRAFRVGFALLVLLAVLLGLLAARLSQGPLPLPVLARLLERTANQPDQPTRLSVGGAALAWEGADADRPLDLRLHDVTLSDGSGRRLAALPDASVTVALRPLLLGRLVPRSVTLSGLDLRLIRSAAGEMALDLGTQGECFDAPPAEAAGAGPGNSGVLAELLAALTRPDDDPFGRHQLRAVVLRQARLAVADAALGLTWSLPDLDLAIRRDARGLRAEGAATLMLAAEAVRLGLGGRWQPAPGQAELVVRMGTVRPAALANAAPALAPLALVDAMVSAEFRVQLDGAFSPQRAAASVRLGPGRITPPGTVGIPIRAATLELDGTSEEVRLAEARVTLDITGAGPPPVLSAQATLRLGAAPALSIEGGMAAFDIAELAHVWPEGFRRNERTWLVPNITAGQLADLAFAMQASLPADFSALLPATLAVTGHVSGATVHYLRPMPPAEDAHGHFRVDLTTADATIEGARIGRRVAGKGSVRLTELDAPVEQADVALDFAAPLPDVLALLQHPRLSLFDTRPLPPAVRNATGTAATKLSIRFPLLSALPAEAVQVAAEAQLADVRLPRLLAGQDVTAARLLLSAGNEGLRLSGTVAVAGSTANATYEQDFRDGPASQVIERLRAEGRAGPRLLAALGIETDGRLVGNPPTTVLMTTRRGGESQAAIRADLGDSRVLLPEAGFEKAPGVAGTLEGTVRLARERILGLENLRAEMPDLSLRGRIGFTRGEPDQLVLTSLALGRSRLSGDVRFGPEGAIALTARGAVLDASPLFAPRAERAAASTPARPLRLDLGFERVWLANDRSAEAVSLRLDRRGGPGGGRIEQLSLSGRTGPEGAFEATVARRASGRSLVAHAADAGALLAAADVITSMTGGRMTLEGSFDDATEALSGSAGITDFRVRDAPAIARVLQAMTLYGLLDLAHGPGLSFSQLTAPFTWQDGVLTLSDARAFSPSLGVTVKGRIDTRAHALDLQGTVVPAYFFNSLLGNIPLIGRLFSPERGGGLFAATYSARGPMSDPQVSVNPLAALTPGFLRGLFGIFDSPTPQSRPAPAAPSPSAQSPTQSPAQSPAPMAPISPPATGGNAGAPPG